MFIFVYSVHLHVNVCRLLIAFLSILVSCYSYAMSTVVIISTMIAFSNLV